MTWKQLEYVASLETMDINANDALVLATFPFESDQQTLQNADDKVDKSVTIIYDNIY